MGAGESSAEVVPGEVPAACVGPRLVLVLRPGARARAVEITRAAGAAGLAVEEVSFPEGSELHGHDVITVAATAAVLQRLAEEHALPKRLDPTLATRGTPARALCATVARGRQLRRPFSRERLGHFAGAGGAPEELFTPAEVQRLLCDELCRARAAETSEPAALLRAQAAGELRAVLALPEEADLERLCSGWAPAALWRPVPGAEIAACFGPSAAQYFIFMHHYARWLVLPTCLGVVGFAFNLLRARPEGAPSHFATSQLSPPFALAVIIWSTLFITHLRRLHAVTRHDLALDSHLHVAPPVDSAWHYLQSRAWKLVDGSVDTEAEPMEADAQRVLRFLVVVFAMLGLLCASCMLVGLLLWIGECMEEKTTGVVLQNLPTLLYLLVVGFFEKFYNWLAECLTHWERHRLYTSHVRSMTLKKAFFQIINYMGWFLYLAFWKKDLDYLRGQLLIFFTVKQVIGNLIEVGWPCAKAAWRARAAAALEDPASPSRRLQDAIMSEWQRPDADIGSDYLEVAVLFAAATWFAPVFPLGLFLALIHAATEAWGDSYKLCELTRRIVRRGANEVVLEAWIDVFMVLGVLGIGISLALFRNAGTSWDPFFVLAVEKLVLFIWLYFQLSIPRVPEWLTEHLEEVERLLPLHGWLPTHEDGLEKKRA